MLLGCVVKVPMSDTNKEGKRSGRSRVYDHAGIGKPRNKAQGAARVKRHTFGSTEKIRRRNRKTWTRLFAKAGRQDDKLKVQEGLDTSVVADPQDLPD